MCASYGLDPRVGDYRSLAAANDLEMIENLKAWAEKNAGETIRPTGKNLRNLNPIVTEGAEGRALELAWWGFLIGGAPSKFPSINTRSERLQEKPGNAKGRALVPATSWFEMQKPSRDWYSFATGGVFAMAGVTQTGRIGDEPPVTCYSIVMQPARDDLVGIHDRMPLLVPEAFYDEWLDPTTTPSRELIDAVLDAGREFSAQVTAAQIAGNPA